MLVRFFLVSIRRFEKKLDAANQRRAPLRDAAKKTNGYRLLHGENDGMPGLIIDRYAEVAVIKLYTPAWIPHLCEVVAALKSISPAERIERLVSDYAGFRNEDLIESVLKISPRLGDQAAHPQSVRAC